MSIWKRMVAIAHNIEICEDTDTDLYEREVGFNQALSAVQDIIKNDV